MKNTDRRDKNRELGRIALRVPRGSNASEILLCVASSKTYFAIRADNVDHRFASSTATERRRNAKAGRVTNPSPTTNPVAATMPRTSRRPESVRGAEVRTCLVRNETPTLNDRRV